MLLSLPYIFGQRQKNLNILHYFPLPIYGFYEVDKNGHINMIWVAMIWVHSDHWYECTNMSDGTQSTKIIDISGLSEWYHKYHLIFVLISVFLLISLKYECLNSYHCKLRLILVLPKYLLISLKYEYFIIDHCELGLILVFLK